MNTYSTFVFESFSFDPLALEIRLNYSLDGDIHFEEVIGLPQDKKIVGKPTDEALLALHIAGGVSYYKTCLPKTIQIESGKLTQTQAEFWNTVYEKGLGEFFYKNKIDYRGLINFPTTFPPPTPNPQGGRNSGVGGGALVPIGGGKDSLVTIERLRKEGKNIMLFRMGSHPLIDALVEKTGLPILTVKRSMPAILFRLNEEGALNGHVPISAYLSALCVVLAQIYGFDEIAMSNEKSSNYGNVEYLGSEINHQWSKSEEFEKMFQKYISENIDTNLKYYSALREMNELEIAEECSNYPEYFEYFTSCNRNWKLIRPTPYAQGGRDSGVGSGQRWCGSCPKCAFSFCLFAACLPKSAVLHIFEKNLFEDASLESLYKELLGLEGVKPFECVGTPEETKEAFERIHQRGEFEDTPIMKMYLSSL